MKVVVKLNLLEDASKYISIDENEVFIMENNVKEVITTSSDDRITALFNLFSFKDEWETENTSEAICEVLFMDEEEEVYAFSKTPDNWMVFLGYIFRLVGGSL